ncbi:hypothetical protein AYO40_05000 [Planctomycetaceae bacterium SCGC AG-212-D15]|nr:hypothetical protein AYO40_05000 [Planctomycetaceae bacterium SCGC AG-212-D15]
MLGSSLTGFGFNPSVLASAASESKNAPCIFNFSLDAGGPVVELLCLKRMLARGIQPDLVMIESHPYFLYGDRIENNELDISNSRLKLEDFEIIGRYDPDGRSRLIRWCSAALLPWSAHRENLSAVLQFLPCFLPDSTSPIAGEVWKRVDRNGWYDWNRLARDFAGFRHSHQSTEQAKQSASCLFNRYASREFSHRAGNAYYEIAELCKKRNIAVALIRMPEMGCVRTDISPRCRSEVETFYADFRRKAGVRVIDARAWVPDEEFWDGFHVTATGATYFSEELDRQIIQPFLKR